MARCFTIVVFLSGLTFLFGCSGGSGGSIPAAIEPLPIVSPSDAVLSPGESAQFTASEGGMEVAGPVWLVNGVEGGNATVGTISSGGVYTAPAALPNVNVIVSVKSGENGPQSAAAPITFFDPKNFAPGTVTATDNPLVATYSIMAPEGATVQVGFGPDTNYGLKTWAQPAPPEGGDVKILVAGMRASTTYHMQAVVHLIDGTQATDSDHSFTTGDVPASVIPQITVQRPLGMTPAPGVEVLCLDPNDGGNELTALVTDLNGNVIWYYPMPPGDWPFPMKLLPNGDMLMVMSPATNSQGEIPSGSTGVKEVREIDLAGNVVYQLTLDQLNRGLTEIGAGFQAFEFHHDILKLPNGHLILLVNYFKTINNQPGIPPGTSVLGDALVDWDPQQGPVWTWSAFDHLDLSHAPYGISDWTHGNSLIYSPDDGDLILSMRNQNMIVKINYDNGAGDGSILWRFGLGGDFTLPSGQSPIEWNYGQHYASIVSPNSAGIFDLMFFNNGNARLVDPEGTICGSPGAVGCYSSVPIFQVNEFNKTAQVEWEDNLSPQYSICCGNASLLSNGDVEYDVAFDFTHPGLATIEEVTREQSPQMVWQMKVTGPLAYRAFRIPSLYPGVVWPQSALDAAAGSASDVRSQRSSTERK